MKQPKVLMAILVGLLAAVIVSGAAAAPEAKVTKLTARDAAANDQFGFSVAVSGGTTVVGAFRDDDAGTSSGSAYVFVRRGGGWSQQAKLTASDAAPGDQFGRSVAISGDTAVIGASGDDDGGSSSGAAYVFVRSDGSWSQQAKLTASDAAANDLFGRSSVALSGETAVVGAASNDDAGPSSGSAYVFVRSGGSWSQQAKLTASDAAPVDFFGRVVALSGETAVVGAINHDDGGSNSGSAYVFVRSGTAWSQQEKLAASDAAANDFFGFSVAISGDTAVIGAGGSDDTGESSGSAYVFVRSGTAWSQQAKLTASDAAAFDQFGRSVAIRGDTAVGGALNEGRPDLLNAGAAYAFERNEGGANTWGQVNKLTASDAQGGDQFGRAVAISEDTAVIIIGAPNKDNTGAAYVFGGGCIPGQAKCKKKEKRK